MKGDYSVKVLRGKKWKRVLRGSKLVCGKLFVSLRRKGHTGVLVEGPRGSITHFIDRRGPITPQRIRRTLAQKMARHMKGGVG